MIPDFVKDKGGSRFIMVIYDETEILAIKSDFYDSFGFIIKIFIIEVDIPSSVNKSYSTKKKRLQGYAVLQDSLKQRLSFAEKLTIGGSLLSMF